MVKLDALKKTTVRALTAATMMILSLAGPVTANPHWHGDKAHGNKHSKHVDSDDREYDRRRGVCYVTPADARIISEYYAPRYRSLPPGLAKKYARTGHLPPGWEKRIEPLPVVVERQLIVLPGDYRRGIIDGQVVIYQPRTHVVLEVVGLFESR